MVGCRFFGLRAKPIGIMTVLLSYWALSHLMGCLSSEQKWDGSVTPSIPPSLRNQLLPIEMRGEYAFHHTDFDDAGMASTLPDGFHLHIENKGDDLFGWSFNKDTTGLLLMRNGTTTSDSGGVYAVGTFAGDSLGLGDPEMWLPNPASRPSGEWTAYGRRMSLISSDTSLWLPDEGISGRDRDPVTGRVRVHVTVFKEVVGEWTTYYAFAKGIGLVAYDQRSNGRLVGSGTIDFATSTLPEATRLWP